jgi:cytochrome c oxidase assembly protein subunit 15
VAIHFAHRVMALVLAVALTLLRLRDPARPGLDGCDARRRLGVRQSHDPANPARGADHLDDAPGGDDHGHVVVGALTLAVTFWLTWVAHRDRIEGAAPLATRSRA